MIYLQVIYKFLVIGLLSFGGGYSTIPLVKDIVDHFDVLNMEMLENFIAISESTPGPIAVNLATFVGKEIAGVFGGVLATLCEILPAFIIILIFVKYFKKYIDNENVKFALSIIRPCIVGIIMSVGIGLYIGGLRSSFASEVDTKSGVKYVIISVLVVLSMIIYKKIFGKKPSAIKIIVLGAILGIAINFIL